MHFVIRRAQLVANPATHVLEPLRVDVVADLHDHSNARHTPGLTNSSTSIGATSASLYVPYLAAMMLFRPAPPRCGGSRSGTSKLASAYGSAVKSCGENTTDTLVGTCSDQKQPWPGVRSSAVLVSGNRTRRMAATISAEDAPI